MSISINFSSSSEGNSGVTDMIFTIEREGPNDEPASVDYEIIGDTAKLDRDVIPLSDTVTFAPGETSKTITVKVIGDEIAEPDEFFSVQLSNPVNTEIWNGYAMGTILNDDGEPPTLSIVDAQVVEGDDGITQMVFPVSLNTASTEAVSLNYSLYTDTYPNRDYQDEGNGSLTFSPGETQQFITLSVFGDQRAELDEIVGVYLHDADNAVILNGYANGTIINDDDIPPNLSIDDITVKEGNDGFTQATFTVTLDRASTEEIVIGYSTDGLTPLPIPLLGNAATGNTAEAKTTDANTTELIAVDPLPPVYPNWYPGVALAGEDYEAVNDTLTFKPGETSKMITLSVLGDRKAELDEALTLQLSNNSDNVVITKGYATATIVNDDGELPTLSVGNTQVTEGNDGETQMTFQVSLSAASPEVVTLYYSLYGDGNTYPNSDYTADDWGSLTFKPGETEQAITISVKGDQRTESDEVISVNLYNADNATILNGYATGTIINDDGTPPNLAVDDITVAEGNDGLTEATFTITLDQASTEEVVVSYATNGWYSQPVMAYESNGPAPMTTRLIDPNWFSRQAIAGEDYQDVNDTLVFKPGETSKTITVPIIGDTKAELDEIVGLQLYSTSDNVVTTKGYATATITNDDADPTLMSIDDVSVTEGDDGITEATFTVTLNQASAENITVEYSTTGLYYPLWSEAIAPAEPGVHAEPSDIPAVVDEQSLKLAFPWFGGATPGEDYTDTKGSLTFQPGETQKTITVPVTGDLIAEADESFGLELFNVSSDVILTKSYGTGTIVNDDGDFTFPIDPVPVWNELPQVVDAPVNEEVLVVMPKSEFTPPGAGAPKDDSFRGPSRPSPLEEPGSDSLTGQPEDSPLAGDDDDSLSDEVGVVHRAGVGKDILHGSADKDQFVFDLGDRFNQRKMGVDVVTEFTRGQDQIVLDRTTFKGLKRLSFATVKSIAEAQKSGAQITYIRKTGSLFYNENRSASGFGTGGQFADLQNGLSLKTSDFLLQD